uniref:Cytochrome P450 n=1 Tax=Quercus lobata TaxID=97700 RepID=A0A7N2M8I6_QUELO
MYGPLMHLQLGEVSNVVSSAETAKEVMKTHDILFSSRPHLLAPDIMSYGSTGTAFAPYGDYWRYLRKICITELLNSKRVQLFQSIREEEVSNLICFISSNAGLPINLSEKFFSLTFGITATAAFGKKCKDQEAFITLAKENLEVAGGFSVSNVEAMTKTGKGKADDLVDVLLNLPEHGELEFPLTSNNIKAVILVRIFLPATYYVNKKSCLLYDIFIASSETSSTTVEWAVSEMLKSPSVMEKA